MTPTALLLSAAVPTASDVANPTFWQKVLTALADWGWKLVQVAIIIVVCIAIAWLLRLVIRRIVRRIVSGVKNKQNVTDTRALTASPIASVRVVQRTRTLGTVLSNIINVVVAIIGIVLVVTTLNQNILPSFAVLTAAIGAGLGFGAQNIVKDVLNGLFMVMEDQLGVGDVVTIPGAGPGELAGIVEVVGIRITQVRDVNGTLWYQRNGEILRLGNLSQGWARVVVDLGVPYDTDVDAVEERMLAVATALAADPRWRSRIVDRPEVWGMQSISADAIVLRVVIKTRTTARDDVARELRKRLKTGLDDLGVALPSLASVVLDGFDGATSVTGAHPPRTRPAPVVSTELPQPKRGRAKRAPSAPSAAPPPETTTKAAPARRPGAATTAQPRDAHPETKRHPQAITAPSPARATPAKKSGTSGGATDARDAASPPAPSPRPETSGEHGT
jgi:small-conductance mechanosensitive channel